MQVPAPAVEAPDEANQGLKPADVTRGVGAVEDQVPCLLETTGPDLLGVTQTVQERRYTERLNRKLPLRYRQS